MVKVGIIGAGWPGSAHAQAYQQAGGFKVVAVADLIPDRRRKLMAEFSVPREYADATSLIADREVEAISICLPNDLHAQVTAQALKAGKHVLCETPPTRLTREAKQIQRAAEKAAKQVLFAAQRRFGYHEQAAKQAVERGFLGEIYHIRAAWQRTRGIPAGTGHWYTSRERAGGGSMMDLGFHMLDLAWFLMGQPKPISVFATSYQAFPHPSAAPGQASDVEDAAFALVRFEGGRSLELSATWSLNQPPSQNGTLCRLHGTSGALDVYTPEGATLYRDFNEKGDAKPVPLKGPKVSGYAGLIRHWRDCLLGRAHPMPGLHEAVALSKVLEGIYRSATTGRSVKL